MLIICLHNIKHNIKKYFKRLFETVQAHNNIKLANKSQSVALYFRCIPRDSSTDIEFSYRSFVIAIVFIYRTL